MPSVSASAAAPKCIGRSSHSSSDLQQERPAAPLWINKAAGLPAPVLATPENRDILSQPNAGQWLFKWKDVPGAQRYQIIVTGATAGIAAANTETLSCEYAMPRKNAYIASPNLRGWTWRVRAQDRNGQWGKWSETREFDVAPMNR
jgi:hypothetical protein